MGNVLTMEALRNAAAALDRACVPRPYTVALHPSMERWMAAVSGGVHGVRKWPRRGSMRARKRATCSLRWTRRMPDQFMGFSVEVC